MNRSSVLFPTSTRAARQGGEQINIPLMARLQAQAIGSGRWSATKRRSTTTAIALWIDWARNAVAIKKPEENKSSIDLFAQAKPRLVDWGKELQRDEICDALLRAPARQTAPAGLGSTNGQRVNGILFDAATAAQRNTWITDNADRILIGSSNTLNLSAGNFATSMTNITSAMTLSGAIVMTA